MIVTMPFYKSDNSDISKLRIIGYLWGNSTGDHWTPSQSASNIVTSSYMACCLSTAMFHDDVIKWKHFPRNWPFVRGIHRSPVNSPHKGQWRGALMFSLICAWLNDWVNNGEAGDLRRHRAHYDVAIMFCCSLWCTPQSKTWHQTTIILT